MPGTIQVDRIELPDGDGVGAIWYLILMPCPTPEAHEHVCETHPGMSHYYERQPFARTVRLGVPWTWDGNRQEPTIQGSLGAFPTRDGISTGRSYNAHLHFVKGKIQLEGDATVALHPNPVPCEFPF